MEVSSGEVSIRGSLTTSRLLSDSFLGGGALLPRRIDDSKHRMLPRKTAEEDTGCRKGNSMFQASVLEAPLDIWLAKKSSHY